MRVIFFLLWLLLPVAAFAQSAEEDRGFLQGLLEDNLSAVGREVRIEGFAGALSSRATIARLTIADDRGIWLTLNRVVLDWSRSALLTGRLTVSELSAAEILLDRLPEGEPSAAPSPEAGTFALPELPVSVEVGRIAAERLVLGEAVLGSPVAATLEASMRLAGGEGEAQLVARRTDGAQGELRLSADYANATRVLALDLALSEGPGGIAARLLDLPGAPPVELTVAGTGPLADYAADIRLATEGTERLAGRITLQGDAGAGRAFTAQLGGNPVPLFLPAYAEFFGPDVRLDVAGTQAPDGRLDLSRIAVETRALRLQGAVQLAADRLPERIALQGEIADPEGQPVLLPLSGPETRVRRLDLTVGYDAAQGDRWTARAAMAGLDRPGFLVETLTLDGGGRIAREAEGATVDGQLAYRADGLRPQDAALAEALGEAIAGVARFAWQQGGDGLRLPELTLEGAGYGLAADLTLEGLSEALKVAGDATLRFEDLSRFAALAGRPLEGSGTATIRGSMALLGGAFDAEAQVEGTGLAVGQPELDSLLAGPSRVALSAVRDAEGTRLRDFRIEARSLTATGSGTIATAGSDITARLDFADLAALGPRYRGRLLAEARFAGTPEQGRISLTADGEGLGIGQPQLDALLGAESRIELEAGTEAQALTLDRAVLTARSLRLAATGRLAAEGSDLIVDLETGDLGALGAGHGGNLQARATLLGTPEDARITAEATGRNLRVGQSAVAGRLLAGESRLSAAVRLEDGRVIVDRAEIRNPQLSLNARGTGTDGPRGFAIDGRLANLALITPQFPGPLTLRGTAAATDTGYRIDLDARGPGGIDLRAEGTAAADVSRLDLTVAGTAQAALANPFIAPRSLSGPLRLDLRLAGPPALQSLSGTVTLSGGRFADPGFGLAIEGLAASARLAGGQAQVEASGRPSNGGRLTVGGSVGLAPPLQADLAIDIAGAVLRDPELYQTVATGRVTVAGPLTGGARIGGQIRLEDTELRIPSTGFGGATNLDGLRHRNEPAAVRATRARAGLTGERRGGGTGGATRQPYPLDLLISAPDRIFVRGRGLDAELGGELRLTGTTANVVPSGAFNLIRGRLDILGRRLVLTEAQLLLEGDFRPYIRVAASTENDGIVTTVAIRGQATEPEVTFTSQPELPQEEVLSRLLFGRGLDTISPLQAAQLASAVATLAGRGGEGVIGRLRQGFGLDDLDVATDAEGDTTLRAGKYVSDNVYTQVEVDQQGQSRINLNLDVTPSITLRGSAGSDGNTGIGIFIERDY